MFTQQLIHLQAVVQRLPVTVDVKRDRRRFQEIDQSAFTEPALQHADFEAGISRFFDQIQRAVPFKHQHR